MPQDGVGEAAIGPPQPPPDRSPAPIKRLRAGVLAALIVLATVLAVRAIFDGVMGSMRSSAAASAPATIPESSPTVPPAIPAYVPAPSPVPTTPSIRTAPNPVFAQFRTWSYGHVVGETASGASCTLDAQFEDGTPILAKGLNQARVAASDGLVSWDYTPPFPGLNDNGAYVLTCARDGSTDRSTQEFELGST